jgi:hypothetical protein
MSHAFNPEGELEVGQLLGTGFLAGIYGSQIFNSFLGFPSNFNTY